MCCVSLPVLGYSTPAVLSLTYSILYHLFVLHTSTNYIIIIIMIFVFIITDCIIISNLIVWSSSDHADTASPRPGATAASS